MTYNQRMAWWSSLWPQPTGIRLRMAVHNVKPITFDELSVIERDTLRDADNPAHDWVSTVSTMTMLQLIEAAKRGIGAQ